MRTTLFTLLSLAVSGTIALAVPAGRAPAPPPRAATPALNLAAVDVAALPERCQGIARRTSLPSPAQALAARTSLATCLWDARVSALQLIDGEESMLAIEAAIAPALALLDEVIAAGDPATKIIAHHTKVQLYAGVTSRMLATVPPALDGTPEATALRDSRRGIVDAMLAPWRAQLTTADLAIVAIAKAHPEVLTNPVVQNAVRDSRARLVATPVAMR